MRAAPVLVSLSLLTSATALWGQGVPVPAPALPQSAAKVSAPEAEIRGNPSDKFPVIGKMRRGEPVKVIEEVPGGWLKIEPPAGSYSWICARFIEVLNPTTAAVVNIGDNPVRVGNGGPDAEPIQEQVKLQHGAQVVLLGEPQMAADGSKWYKIVPPPQEARYILKDAIAATPTVETLVSAAPAAPVGPAPAVPAPADTLLAQAEQAERNGDVNRAMQLYQQQAQQTTDRDLQARCYNRMQFLRDAGQSVTATPVAGAQTGPVQGQPVSYSPPPRPAVTAPAMQTSGPGYLRRAGFWVDGRPTFMLTDSQGRPMMYATGQQGLNLELFTNQAVELYGTINYRPELRTNYIVVGQVRQLQ